MISKKSRKRSKSQKRGNTPYPLDENPLIPIKEMGCNIVEFPRKRDTQINRFFKNNQEVLEGGSTDLSNYGADCSSLQKTQLEQARYDAQRAMTGKMSKTELNKKYKPTYNCWRNMKQRVKEQGLSVHPEFTEFSSFLFHMGPRPSHYYTLDRIDNDNPHYGPDLCRWSDKRGQANNRRSTIYLTDDEGVCLPISEWARRTGQKADTMRRRHTNGWTNIEIIKGQRVTRGRVKPQNYDSDPMPWRGTDNELLNLENWYLDELEMGNKYLANRYEAYEFVLRNQLSSINHRLDRARGTFENFIYPPEDLPTIEYFQAQFEPLGSPQRIYELTDERDAIQKLLNEIHEEHQEWKAACSRITEDNLMLLSSIKAKQRKLKK